MNAITRFEDEFQFLSNFYECEVEFEGLKFPSVEAAYQAAKLLDINKRAKFQTMTPSEAKRAGKASKIRPDWDNIRLSVMETLLRQKFSQPELKNALLMTQDFELIEGNWWKDTFWGVCNGVGENHLGKLLMKIRNQIKEQNNG